MVEVSPQQALLPLGLEHFGWWRQAGRSQATPIATQLIAKDFPALPHGFFCRPAEVVAPELIGCRLVKRQEGGELLWGVIVETEAYSQDDPATATAAAPPATKRSLGSLGVFMCM